MNFITAGESHGKGLTGIITDYPSGVAIDIDLINNQLARRQKGYGRGGRMLIENDRADIISGIRKGISTGSPISFIINNKDWENWKDIMEVMSGRGSPKKEEDLLTPRPGHADLPGMLKYHLGSIRDVIERSSARETAARVCIGAFASAALNMLDVNIISYVNRIGDVSLDESPDMEDRTLIAKIEDSKVRCPDESISEKMMKAIDRAKDSGDSIGGSFKVIAKNMPVGLGSFVQWDKRLDARLAFAVISIPAIKAFEIGNGFKSGSSTGLDFHDEIDHSNKKGFFRNSNNAGGIEGGMTNGEDIVIGAVMKPIPTTTKGMKTINIRTKEESISLKERSDVCAVPSAAIVAEAAVSIELLSAIQEKFGSDNMDEIISNINNYKKYLKNI